MSTNGGTVVNNGDGTLTHPATDFNGSDSFTYTLTDDDGETATATVTITVNAVDDGTPVALNDTVTTDEDTLVTTGNVLANDTLTDNAVLSSFNAVSANGGSVTDNGDGTFDYTPAANFNGSDSFTYTLTDDEGETATATVTITVNAVDDGTPVALNDVATTDEDTLVTTGNVLANDSLNDNATITAFDAVSANGGTITDNGDGTFNYTPAFNFNGIDSFTYTLTDDEGDTSTATVWITVNPIDDGKTNAVSDLVQTNEDVPITTADLRINDDLFDNATISDFDTVTVEGGTVIYNGDGSFTYTPPINFNGQDQFTYTLTDEMNQHSTTTVTVQVIPVNDLPTTTGINDITVLEDASDSVLDLIASFLDLETATQNMSFSLTSNTNIALFSDISIDSNGTLTVSYMNNANGIAQITLRATDEDGAYVETSFQINVEAVNDAPQLAQNSLLVTTAGFETTINNTMLMATDVDDVARNLTFTITSISSTGVLLLNGSPMVIGSTFTQDDVDSNRLSFVSDSASGSDVAGFEFEVRDESGAITGTNTFSIHIQPQSTELSLENTEESVIEVDSLTEEPEVETDPEEENLEQLPILENENTDDESQEFRDVDVDSEADYSETQSPELAVRARDETLRSSIAPTDQEPLADVVETDSTSVDSYSTTETSRSHLHHSNLQRALDLLDQQLQQANEEQKSTNTIVAGAVKGTGASLSAAYLAWLLRAGPLLASILTSMPVWTRFDPLPVILSTKTEKEKTDDDAEEAAAVRIFESNKPSPQHPGDLR